jgi:alpha-galactosidase
MERFNRRFPDILFEGCAGGGGRFDLGILSYQPQIWASDNMDGQDRLLIQYGTSFAYPAICQGSHVASSPNHITKRESPLKWRALLAMGANMGVEADISKWTPEERQELSGYIALYKEIRPIIQFGLFHRLEAPYGNDRAAWIYVSPDQKDACLFVFQIKSAKEPFPPVKLRGLNPDSTYEISEETGNFRGELLMSGKWLPKEFRVAATLKPFTCGYYRLKTI